MKTLTLSILQFNTFIKNILDAEEFLSNISVFGEVTNFKISGGNAYFDLKDSNAMLSCVKFGADDLDIKNGDLITVFGKVNFYVKSGRLNFIVAKTNSYGLGDLYQKFLELKNKLEQEGYFREEIKKEIPRHAKRLGVVTSETGAVIRDIINVTKSKNKFTDIVVYPSKVQGVGAEDEIAAGIKYFNSRNDIDVIIVARGGGSLEDLSPFNTEKIVKAIYDSRLPIISAVGHETDFTLCDFAADLRVPTPSVAAEVAVFDYAEEVNRIRQTCAYFYSCVLDKISPQKKDLANTSQFISKSIKLKVVESRLNLNGVLKSLQNSINIKYQENKNKIEKLMDVLIKLNPLEILKIGYVTVEKNGEKIINSANLDAGDEIKIYFNDGAVNAVVKDKEN